jgi:hypothetical protein
MAAGIALLYENPENFAAMSKAASERVSRQSAKLLIINAEMDVLA